MAARIGGYQRAETVPCRSISADSLAAGSIALEARPSSCCVYLDVLFLRFPCIEANKYELQIPLFNEPFQVVTVSGFLIRVDHSTNTISFLQKFVVLPLKVLVALLDDVHLLHAVINSVLVSHLFEGVLGGSLLVLQKNEVLLKVILSVLKIVELSLYL
jgi:hypothetical protein